MATITGTLKFTTDEEASIGVTFVPQDTPDVISGSIVIAQNSRIQTGSDGTFQVELLEGGYTVQVDNGEEFDIDVPGTAGPFDIVNLVVSDSSSAASTAYRPAGVGSPEGRIRGEVGWSYYQTDSGAVWFKDSGTGTTGWVPKVS